MMTVNLDFPTIGLSVQLQNLVNAPILSNTSDELLQIHPATIVLDQFAFSVFVMLFSLPSSLSAGRNSNDELFREIIGNHSYQLLLETKLTRILNDIVQCDSHVMYFYIGKSLEPSKISIVVPSFKDWLVIEFSCLGQNISPAMLNQIVTRSICITDLSTQV